MKIVIFGIKNALSDPAAEVRAFAASATGKLAEKIGIANADKYFQFLYDTLDNEESNSIERSGAANALSEIIYS